MDNTDEDTMTEDWTVDQPLAQTRTTAIVEVKGAVNVVLTPLVAEALDRSDITAALTSPTLCLMLNKIMILVLSDIMVILCNQRDRLH